MLSTGCARICAESDDVMHLRTTRRMLFKLDEAMYDVTKCCKHGMITLLPTALQTFQALLDAPTLQATWTAIHASTPSLRDPGPWAPAPAPALAPTA